MPRKGLSEEIKNKICNMYKSGVSNQEIANLIGVSFDTVCRVARAKINEGVLSPKRQKSFGKPKVYVGKGKYIKKGYSPQRKLTQDQEKELLIDYFENNMTYKQIMEKYKVWQKTIKRIIDNALKLGIYKPKKRHKAYSL